MSQPEKSQVEEWKEVYWGLGLLPAQAVQGYLESAGIPTVLNYDVTTLLYAGTSEVRILVPSDRMAEACELLDVDRELDEDEDADSKKC
jgi:hypothetical protein